MVASSRQRPLAPEAPWCKAAGLEMRWTVCLLLVALVLSGCAQIGLGNGAVPIDETRRSWCYDHPEAVGREMTDDDDVVHRAALFEWPVMPTSRPLGMDEMSLSDAYYGMYAWRYPGLTGQGRSDLEEAVVVFRRMAPSAYTLACQRAWDHR